MDIARDNIRIREALQEDAQLIKKWWNDGKVMEHAGFPNGLGISLEEVLENIRSREGKLSKLCIIEIDNRPVGELSYSVREDGVYPGWKICDENYQNKGYGPRIIELLFEFLFTDEGLNSRFRTEKIIWDTSLDNKRAQYVYEEKIGARKTRIEEASFRDQLGNLRTAIYYEIDRETFFLDRLRDEEIHLRLESKSEEDREKGYVPAYYFKIVLNEKQLEIGSCDLRFGYNENIEYGGNIGYEIQKEFRGNNYAAKAVHLLLKFGGVLGMEKIFITCHTENLASIKTCEKLGAEFLGVIDQPKWTELYREGQKQSCKYMIKLDL